ncbi:MAG: CoA transferase [Dehalococcoidia bacterium]|nr:CoA transferase [Dehalococcoidia bacterium]
MPLAVTSPIGRLVATRITWLTRWLRHGVAAVHGARTRLDCLGFTALASIHAYSRGSVRKDGPVVLDVSIQDVMVSLHQWTFSLYTHQGVIKRRAGTGTPNVSPNGVPAVQRRMGMRGRCLTGAMERFCIAIIERLGTHRGPSAFIQAKRFDHADQFDGVARSWFDVRTREEVVAHLQAHSVPLSRVLQLLRSLDDEQLDFRKIGLPLIETAIKDGRRLPGSGSLANRPSGMALPHYWELIP